MFSHGITDAVLTYMLTLSRNLIVKNKKRALSLAAENELCSVYLFQRRNVHIDPVSPEIYMRNKISCIKCKCIDT